jgi:hypothetical protein
LCGQTDSFEVGITGSLLHHLFGVVGEVIIKESSSTGHWQGVDIPQGSKSLISVQPILLLEGAD